ncbi:MAG: heptaprenylglyceryl phosphate synthase [Halobacteria archaeon]|nr:heptaprenylglyceryl phosphate synthase [Halobacteria archaeon]
MQFDDWKDWDHITKLDPDKSLSQDEISRVCESGTDAIMVGGTQGVTEKKVHELVKSVREHDIPLTVEPSNPESVIHDIDWLFVPSVLNAGGVTWLIGLHKEWVRLDDDIDWDTTSIEGYIVLNPESAVGKMTDAYMDLRLDDVVAYATVGERFFNLPIIYIEYSGTFGDPEIVKAVSKKLERSTLFYGGGINSYEKATTMAQYADTIIVGNAVYEDGIDALRETVRGAKQA